MSDRRWQEARHALACLALASLVVAPLAAFAGWPQQHVGSMQAAGISLNGGTMANSSSPLNMNNSLIQLDDELNAEIWSGNQNGQIWIDVAGTNRFKVTNTTVSTSVQLLVTGVITGTSTITSSGTSDLGWAVVDQTDNQACNTGCTSACVFGWDVGAPGVLLACTNATADLCLCAGSS